MVRAPSGRLTSYSRLKIDNCACLCACRTLPQLLAARRGLARGQVYSQAQAPVDERRLTAAGGEDRLLLLLFALGSSAFKPLQAAHAHSVAIMYHAIHHTHVYGASHTAIIRDSETPRSAARCDLRLDDNITTSRHRSSMVSFTSTSHSWSGHPPSPPQSYGCSMSYVVYV